MLGRGVWSLAAWPREVVHGLTGRWLVLVDWHSLSSVLIANTDWKAGATITLIQF